MRTLFCSILFLGLFSLLPAQEAERSVYLRPSTDSPVIGNLPEGAFVLSPAEPVELTEREIEEGWEPISFLDDLRGFVRRTDLTKDLFVTPGAAVYAADRLDPSIVITHAEENDLFEVERMAGDWVEVSFRKPVTAFVRSSDSSASAPTVAGESAPAEQSPDEPLVQEEASRRAAISDRAAIPTDGILRAYEGLLSKPRSFFGRPPHPFQVVDASGNRIAYLDLSRLLITTPLEHFLGREFHFYGRAEAIEGKRDFVIRVEQMRRR